MFETIQPRFEVSPLVVPVAVVVTLLVGACVAVLGLATAL